MGAISDQTMGPRLTGPEKFGRNVCSPSLLTVLLKLMAPHLKPTQEETLEELCPSEIEVIVRSGEFSEFPLGTPCPGPP